MTKLRHLRCLARIPQQQFWSGTADKLPPRCLSVDPYCTSSGPADDGFSGAMELWTWGKGEFGQLGLGDEETRRFPYPVKSLHLPLSSAVAPVEGLLNYSTREHRPSPQPVENSYSTKRINFQERRGNEECQNAVSGSKPFVRPMHISSRAGVGGGVGIACGLFHSGLWVDGQLWLWGKGSGGRLGLGSEEPEYNPTHVSSLRDVTSVSLGGLHSAAIAGGNLYTWGFGGFGALGHGNYSKQTLPKQLCGEDWMENVKAVSAGGSHTAAISSTGELYTWGRDEGEGRLGHGAGGGADEGAEPFPIKVEALPTPVAAVACGGFCTMALTPEGQLWSWGGNSNFELGRGNRQDDWRPKPIPEIETNRIIQVACGGYHAAALTDDGQMLTWGHGGHGQLGHGSLQNGRVPSVVEALANERVVSISCGSSWTAAITESGELYTWGKNRDSQLGVPSLKDTQMTPILVTFEDVESNGDTQSTFPHVMCVTAGSTHGTALVYRTTRRVCSPISKEGRKEPLTY
ncbi:unnamed protein product [Calypogeia fissa]